MSHLFASQFISSLAIYYILSRHLRKRFTNVKVSWINGHESLLIELVVNPKNRSLWKPDLSWFFRCSEISNLVYSNFEMCSLVILEQDWNTCARSSSVRSLSDSRNVSRFFIEQTTLTKGELLERGNSTIKLWLFCKYPSTASHSKMMKRLSSAWRLISNDLH